MDVISLLAETGIFQSKGEARKMVQNGGISMNRKKIENQQHQIMSTDLLHNQYLLVQKGKKNYYLIKAE
jgi:tyrosyl-tRNA synthetase